MPVDLCKSVDQCLDLSNDYMPIGSVMSVVNVHQCVKACLSVGNSEAVIQTEACFCHTQ